MGISAPTRIILHSRAPPTRAPTQRQPAPPRTPQRLRDPPRVTPPVAVAEAKCWWLEPGPADPARPQCVLHFSSSLERPPRTRRVAHSAMAPSRQERRKAERAAAKRAPAQTGAVGAAGAAAALANVNLNSREPDGDWTTQSKVPTALLEALGATVVKRMAGAYTRPLFGST